tara:strand:+ start:4043 stop:5473 length:1431 start_codon:yes stop_codon:yes gene_type:complete
MSNCTIKQKPKYNYLPVGQDVIFSITNDPVVAQEVRVKFICKVFISGSSPAQTGSGSADLIGTFKTVPNNAGAGIFDLRQILESFVKADNTNGSGVAKHKTVSFAEGEFPIHLVDKLSRAMNSIRYLKCQFKVEYEDPSSSTGALLTTGTVNSDDYVFFNGYLNYEDEIDRTGNDFGYSLGIFKLNAASGSPDTHRFLTNAPTIQYANPEDYGTSAVLLETGRYGNDANGIKEIKFTFHKYDGSTFDKEYDVDFNNGAFVANAQDQVHNRLLYVGVFPANLRGWSSTVDTALTAGEIEYYTYKAEANGSVDISQEYRVNVLCPKYKGYVPIRLAWMNQWGTWDYYTFTQKSVKTISTKESSYNQLGGTWNQQTYRTDSFRGGKKTFRRNATEKIKMNTDYISETEAAWFEELMNSPEVYILKGYDASASTDTSFNTVVTPVRMLTKSYVKKTVANDKLIQYTFEVEKSKTFRTQSV